VIRRRGARCSSFSVSSETHPFGLNSVSNGTLLELEEQTSAHRPYAGYNRVCGAISRAVSRRMDRACADDECRMDVALGFLAVFSEIYVFTVHR